MAHGLNQRWSPTCVEYVRISLRRSLPPAVLLQHGGHPQDTHANGCIPPSIGRGGQKIFCLQIQPPLVALPNLKLLLEDAKVSASSASSPWDF